MAYSTSGKGTPRLASWRVDILDGVPITVKTTISAEPFREGIMRDSHECVFTPATIRVFWCYIYRMPFCFMVHHIS